MSKVVANVNGKNIYSDKGVHSIINTRVTFTDGSWCDVATGEIVNKGRGYISLNSPVEGSSEKITLGPTSHIANNLVIRNVEAVVDIQPHNQNTIEFSISGPEAEVKNIKARFDDLNTVTIEGLNGKSSSRGVTIISGGRNIVSIGGIVSGSIVAGGNVVVSGRGLSSFDTKITVKVPLKAYVELDRVQGQSTVGNTEGNFRVNSQSGDVTAGRVGSSVLNVQGSGDITIYEVNGTLDARVQGSGSVEVENGTLQSLRADVMGSGDIRFNGNAEDAQLNLMGSGDIRVKYVKNRPSMKSVGSGDIRVSNWR